MSLISRLKHKIQIGILPKPYYSPNPIHRTFAQPALQPQDEEEFEIDPKKLPADYDPSKFDPTAHRSAPSERVFKLVDDVSSLTLIETAELGSILMGKMGMGGNEAPVIGVLNPGAAAGLARMGTQSAGGGAEEVAKEEEKSLFELKLEAFESGSKLKVIKEIRGLTDLGLKEAKDLVEKAPAVFKRGVPKEEAQQIVDKLKAAGAKVVME